MSFQDVGRQQRKPANAALSSSSQTSSRAAESSSWTTGGGSSSGSVGQISESLTQYQRNVGILEKIAQQLLSTPGNHANRNELENQFQLQLDVLRQLEQRVRELIISNRNKTSNNQQLIKLERDFERVQGTANASKARVQRQQKQMQQRGAAGVSASAADRQENSAANVLQQEQQRFQVQLEQDRLNSEIMQEREQEIRNINKGMHQVNEIYKDLAHIVGSQQEQVDQIETQMEDARDNAESGLEQVQKANDKYNQANCIIS